MKTKKNSKGECFEVTFEKEFELKRNYTYRFILRREEDVDPLLMERMDVDIMKMIDRIGCVVLFTNLPRPTNEPQYIPCAYNSPMLEAIFKKIENGECV